MIVRSIADKLGERLDTAIVVDNRPGASGFIGAQAVVAAPADGYTLLMGFDGSLVIASNIIKPSFDPLSDLLFRLVRAPRTTWLANCCTSNRACGSRISLTREGGQAITDVVSGQVPMVVTVVSTAQGFVRDGRLNAIAVSSRERSPMLPDVPTPDAEAHCGTSAKGDRRSAGRPGGARTVPQGRIRRCDPEPSRNVRTAGAGRLQELGQGRESRQHSAGLNRAA